MNPERRASFANVSVSLPTLDASRAASSLSQLPEAAPSWGDALSSTVELIRVSPTKDRVFVALVLTQVFLTLVERVWLYSFSFTPGSGGGRSSSPGSPFFRESLWVFLAISTTACYVAYFALSSLLYTNYVEMLMYLVTSMVLLGRLLAEAVARSDECEGSNLAACYTLLVLIGLCVLGAMGLSSSMMQELRVKRHKALGARTATQRVYFLYEVYAAVRTLDFQFALVTLITGLVFLTSTRAGPYAPLAVGLNVALLLCELAWNWLGREGIRRERAKLLWGFWALSPLLPAFILAVALETGTSGLLLVEAEGQTLRATIFVVGLLTIACRLATVALSYALYTLFGPDYVQLRRIIESDRSIVFQRRRANYAPTAAAVAAAAAAAAAAEGTVNPVAAAAAAASEGSLGQLVQGGQLPGQAAAVEDWAAGSKQPYI